MNSVSSWLALINYHTSREFIATVVYSKALKMFDASDERIEDAK